MNQPNPKLVLVLFIVLAFAIYLKLSNPYKKYSQQEFWEVATTEDLQSIPEEALRPGNKNGPVLTWAATTTRDPSVISALVEMGADVNEPDIIFSGTPLSAAAGFNSNPEIINELVRLGAKIDAVVGSNDKTPLIIAAEINPNPEILKALIKNGANTSYTDKTGRNALEAAKKYGSEKVVRFLENIPEQQL